MTNYKDLYFEALRSLRAVAARRTSAGYPFFELRDASYYAEGKVRQLENKEKGIDNSEVDPTPLVIAFHEKYGQAIEPRPILPDDETLSFRLELAKEELIELEEAIEMRDLYKLADALGDKVYIDYGTALVCGIPLSPVLVEIHRSNMTKDINPKGGKPLKGSSFKEPQLPAILDSVSSGSIKPENKA